MEKAELNIYIHTDGNSASDEEKVGDKAAGRKNTQGAFRRPRTRSQSHGMDVLANIKNAVGDEAYKKRFEKIKEKNDRGAFRKPRDPNKEGKKAEYNARAGIALAAYGASAIVSTGLDLVGTFTSNQAQKNKLDNLMTTANQGLSLIGSIGAGAAVGGWVGAAIALATEALKFGTQALKTAVENDRSNKEKALDAERRANRLGYIEAGYSR